MDKDTQMLIASRLREARERKGYDTARAAARYHGWNTSTYAQHENGTRGLGRSATKYAKVFGVPLGWLLGEKEYHEDIHNAVVELNPKVKAVTSMMTHTTPTQEKVKMVPIPIVGEVAAGIWRENTVAAEKYGDTNVATDPRYPENQQFGLVVKGNSINKFANDGDILHCVRLWDTGVQPQDGDLVIVERRRAQGAMIETTAKILRQNGKLEFWPYSHDPSFGDPIIIDEKYESDDEDIVVVAIVVGAQKVWSRHQF